MILRRQRQHNTILFGTGNYYRSRFAKALFNSVAGNVGLPWQALFRGLALERGVNNIGPMAVEASKALGVRPVDAVTRSPAHVTRKDLKVADRIVALKRDEHLP